MDAVVVNGIWQYNALGVWRALRHSGKRLDTDPVSFGDATNPAQKTCRGVGHACSATSVCTATSGTCSSLTPVVDFTSVSTKPSSPSPGSTYPPAEDS